MFLVILGYYEVLNTKTEFVAWFIARHCNKALQHIAFAILPSVSFLWG